MINYFLRIRCLFSKSSKKSFYGLNTIHPILASVGQRIITLEHLGDQCLSICVAMFGTCVGPMYKQQEDGRAEGNFHMSILAGNEALKPKPSLSSTFTLQPAAVPVALTSSMPFHTLSPFLALKSSALQLLSPGTASWYHSASATLHLISHLSRKHPFALVLPLDEQRREPIFNSKAFEQTLYRKTLCSIVVKHSMLHLCPGDFSGL